MGHISTCIETYVSEFVMYEPMESKYIPPQKFDFSLEVPNMPGPTEGKTMGVNHI
jgi:hypothetical protein